MALLDICGQATERGFGAEIPAGVLGTTLTDIVAYRFDVGQRAQVKHAPVWPVDSDVKIGVGYGPTGVEYTGTYAGGGGGGHKRVRIIS